MSEQKSAITRTGPHIYYAVEQSDTVTARDWRGKRQKEGDEK